MSEIRLNTSSLEINLLQLDDTARNSTLWLRPMLLLLMFVIGMSIAGWMWFDTSAQKEQLNKDIASADSKIAELQAQQSLTSTASAGVPLSVWLEMPSILQLTRPQTTAWLDQLTSLLPRDANIKNLIYTDGGKVQVNGSFATMENIITFTREIDESESFKFISTSSINNRIPVSSDAVQVIQNIDETNIPTDNAPVIESVQNSKKERNHPPLEVTIELELEYLPSLDGDKVEVNDNDLKAE